MNVYTVPQAAKLLHVSKDKVRAWIAAGRLGAFNVNQNGKRPSYRINDAHLAAFQERCSVLSIQSNRKALEPIPFKRY